MSTVDLLFIGPSTQEEVVFPTTSKEGNITQNFRLELTNSMGHWIFFMYSYIFFDTKIAHFKCTDTSRLHVGLWNMVTSLL